MGGISGSGLQLFNICSKAQNASWSHSLALQLLLTRVHYLSITSSSLIESSSQGTSNFLGTSGISRFLLLIPADCTPWQISSVGSFTSVRSTDSGAGTAHQLNTHLIARMFSRTPEVGLFLPPPRYCTQAGQKHISCIPLIWDKWLTLWQTFPHHWTSFSCVTQSHFWSDIAKSCKDSNWISRIGEDLFSLSQPCSSNWG